MRLNILGFLLLSGLACAPALAQEEAAPEAEAPAEPEGEAAPEAEAEAAPKGEAEAVPEGGRVPVLQRAPSLQGPNGLDQVWSADPGPQGTVRLRFSYGFFNVDDWPADGHSNEFSAVDFSLAYTPLDYLELFLNTRSTSNVNKGGSPSLLQTQGDLSLGAKGGGFVTDGIALAATLGMRLVSGLGDGGWVGDGIGWEFRGIATFDWKRSSNIPLRLHLDTAFVLENGEAVFADQPEEPSVIQEWGLQAYRYDRLHIGIGVEIPASPYVTPFAEYRIGTPFLVELTRRGPGTHDFEFSSVPHNMAVGLRAFPLPELAVDAVYRLGFSDDTYTGVQATPPWMVVLGLSYTLDPRPQIVEREVEAKAVAPEIQLGQIAGRVTNKEKEGVAAQISYPGSGRSPQLADETGRFGGYQFAPGDVAVRVSAEGYKTYSKTVQVAKDKTTALDVELEPDPEAAKGKVEVRVFDHRGKPMGAGVTIGELAGDALPDIPFTGEIKPGKYTLSVGTAGFKMDTREVEIKPGETLSLRVPLKRGKGGRPGGAKKPRKVSSGGAAPAGKRAGGGLVVLKGSTLRLKRKVTFEGKTDTLSSGGKKVLDDMAKVLDANPQVKRVRINVHTDGRGERAALTSLSNQQGQAVKSYLVKKGVSAKRLRVKGYGPDKPIAPNLTERGRAKNRRVGFIVTEMAQ